MFWPIIFSFPCARSQYLAPNIFFPLTPTRSRSSSHGDRGSFQTLLALRTPVGSPVAYFGVASASPGLPNPYNSSTVSCRQLDIDPPEPRTRFWEQLSSTWWWRPRAQDPGCTWSSNLSRTSLYCMLHTLKFLQLERQPIKGLSLLCTPNSEDYSPGSATFQGPLVVAYPKI